MLPQSDKDVLIARSLEHTISAEGDAKKQLIEQRLKSLEERIGKEDKNKEVIIEEARTANRTDQCRIS